MRTSIAATAENTAVTTSGTQSFMKRGTMLYANAYLHSNQLDHVHELSHVTCVLHASPVCASMTRKLKSGVQTACCIAY